MSSATELQKSHQNYFTEMPAWGAYLREGVYSRDMFSCDRDFSFFVQTYAKFGLEKAVLATVAKALIITRRVTSLGNGHMP